MGTVGVGLYSDAAVHGDKDTLEIAFGVLYDLDGSACDQYIQDNLVDIVRALDTSSRAVPYDYTQELIEGVSDLITDRLPDYQYADYSDAGGGWGIWVSHDSLQDDIRYGEVATVDDGGNIVVKGEPIPTLAVHVNDHGNTTLYRVKIELEEVWSVV